MALVVMLKMTTLLGGIRTAAWGERKNDMWLISNLKPNVVKGIADSTEVMKENDDGRFTNPSTVQTKGVAPV